MIREACFWLAGALVALAVWRAGVLLLCRRAVHARTIGSNLTEMQRGYDRDAYFIAHNNGWPSADDVPWRPVLLRVAYEIDGIEHRGDVRVLVGKGERPDAAQTIWVARRDPARATGIGPLWVTPLLVAAGALLVVAARIGG